MEVTIHLTTFGYSVTVSKEELRTMKGSLLAQALETDPEATRIDIANPLVKPEHLEIVASMAQRVKRTGIMSMDLEDKDYVAAANYLNCPLLEVVRSSAYGDSLHFAPYVDIYRPETYGSLLTWSRIQALWTNKPLF